MKLKISWKLLHIFRLCANKEKLNFIKKIRLDRNYKKSVNKDKNFKCYCYINFYSEYRVCL